MKRDMIKLLLLFTVLSIVLTGCKDERNNNMVDDTIGFLSDHIKVPVLNEKYELAIHKSGKGQSAATARVAVSEGGLQKYNEENGTDFVMLPANYYSFTSTEITIPKKDSRGIIELTWNSGELVALGNSINYVIPLEVTVVDSSLEVPLDRDIVLVEISWSFVSMETDVASTVVPEVSGETTSHEAAVIIDYAITKMDIEVGFVVDNSLISTYNSANDTNYVPVPDGLVIMPSGVTLQSGQTSAKFDFQLVSDKLFNGNELLYSNDFLIPLRLTSVSGDGIEIGDLDIMYIPVSLHEELKGPWAVLEGQDNCYATDPNDGANWTLVYTTDRLFDGDFSTEWISWWATDVPFPQVFVVDMQKTNVFTNFIIADYVDGWLQGNFRNYEIYIAQEYDGASTNWQLVASGLRDLVLGVQMHDYPVQKMIRGQYLKFVILNAESDNPNTDFIHGRGKLSEVFGQGF